MQLLIRSVLFVLVGIVVAPLGTFLAVQYPLVFLALLAVFIYFFSRAFQNKRAFSEKQP